MQEKKLKDGLSVAKECSWAKQKNKKKLKKTNNGYIQLANHPRGIYLGWFFLFFYWNPQYNIYNYYTKFLSMSKKLKTWSVRKGTDSEAKGFAQMSYGSQTLRISKQKGVILVTHGLKGEHPTKEERKKIIAAVTQQLG